MGPGSLFSFPFVSRALLYRLIDDDISVLICQDTDWMQSETRVDIRGDACNFTIKDNDAKVFAYRGLTASSSIEDIVRPPRIDFSLPKTERLVFEFPRISITVELCLLRPEGLISSFDQVEYCQVEIEDSDYFVASYNMMRRAGGLVPPNLAALPYSRIAIVSKDTNAEYGIRSTRKWSLSASGFCDDKISPPKFTMHLRGY